MEELTKKELVKIEISNLLKQISDKSVENTLRKIIFAHDDVISWGKVYTILKEECPELKI